MAAAATTAPLAPGPMGAAMMTTRVKTRQAAQAELRDPGMPSRSRGSYEVGAWGGGSRRILPTSLQEGNDGKILLERTLPEPCPNPV